MIEEAVLTLTSIWTWPSSHPLSDKRILRVSAEHPLVNKRSHRNQSTRTMALFLTSVCPHPYSPLFLAHVLSWAQQLGTQLCSRCGNNLCRFRSSWRTVSDAELMTSGKVRPACRNATMGWNTGNAANTGGVVCASHERSEQCPRPCQDRLTTESGRDPQRVSTPVFPAFLKRMLQGERPLKHGL